MDSLCARPLSTTRTVVVFCFFPTVPSSSTSCRASAAAPDPPFATDRRRRALASPSPPWPLLASSRSFSRLRRQVYTVCESLCVRVPCASPRSCTSAVRSRTHRRPPLLRRLRSLLHRRSHRSRSRARARTRETSRTTDTPRTRTASAPSPPRLRRSLEPRTWTPRRRRLRESSPRDRSPRVVARRRAFE